MYGILDNLKDLGLELELPLEVFATSFNNPCAYENLPDFDKLAYTKDFACPVCRAAFQASVLRASKLRLSHMEGLRPVYKDIEPLCYDIMMCTNCGYATFRDRFDIISEAQQDLLLEKIRMNYLNFMPATHNIEISPMAAVEMYKYALLTACIKRTSLGEKAMLLIKLTWLYKIMEDEQNVAYFTKLSYEYLSKAFASERFPIFGMSEGAVTFLLASFASDLGDYSAAVKFLSEIIVNKELSSRLRDLARDKKDEINELKKACEENPDA